MTISSSSISEFSHPERGTLERPLAEMGWVVPPFLMLEGEYLIWKHLIARGKKTSWPHPIKSKAGLLENFLFLADSPAQRILNYARKWGVLGICSHDLPTSHNSKCRPLGWREGKYRDPLKVWRRFSSQMRGLLNIAARLSEMKPGKKEDWQAVYYTQEPESVRWGQAPLQMQQFMVAQEVNEWLGLSQARPQISWFDNNPVVSFDGMGLFGALTIQLMLAISRTDGMALCSACGLSYIPMKRPKANLRRYCPDCRTKQVPGRDAARDYRTRMEKAKRFASEGLPLKNIAAQHKTDVSRVRKWRSKGNKRKSPNTRKR